MREIARIEVPTATELPTTAVMRDLLAQSSLPGVFKSPVFVTSFDGSESILANESEDWPGFVSVDNSNGVQRKLKCLHVSSNEALNGKNEHCGLLASDDVIWSLIRNQENGKYFVTQYKLDDASKSITIEKEISLGVQRCGRAFADLHQYGNHMYAIVWWHTEEAQSRAAVTGYHVVRIESGSQDLATSGEVLAANKTVDGIWFAPFVSQGDLIFVSCTKLCSVSLTDERKKPAVFSHSEWPSPATDAGWSSPRLFNGLAHYYILDSTSNIGQIWTLGSEDGKKWKWSETKLRFKSHALSSSVLLTITTSDILFLHGSCADATCPMKTHIYQIDLTKPPQWNHTEERLLGSGGFASVFAIKADDSTVENYAIKVLHKAVLHDSDVKIIRLAVNEARTVKSLSHPSIVKCFGFYFELDRIVTVMELLGRSLRDIIMGRKEKCLKETEIIHHSKQIVEALLYLHTRPKPIIHRDIKCANIMVDSSGNAKLCDFGLGREIKLSKDFITRHSCAPQEATGTVHWMAPEVHEKQAYGRKADIWSFGCTLVEMLTGNPPYHDLGVNEYCTKLNNGQLHFRPQDLVPHASPEIHKLLEKTLFHKFVCNFHRATSNTSSMRKSFIAVKKRFTSSMQHHNDKEHKEAKELKKNKHKAGAENASIITKRADARDILVDILLIELASQRKRRHQEVEQWHENRLHEIQNIRNTGREADVSRQIFEEVAEC